MNNWKIKSTTTPYENKWIKVDHHEVVTPSGTDGIYGKVHFKNIAVGIIALDEDHNIWLVGQYRFTLDLYSWEIPEGGCPEGEDPLEAAKRELKEETGIIAEQWSSLGTIHTSNSVTDEVGYIYLAEQLTYTSPEPEETEDLALKKIPLSQAVEMVMDNEITDSISIAGILKLAFKMQNSNQIG
jgi:ADP-ribose pyrophosphatase